MWTWSTGNTEFDLAYIYMMYTGIKDLDALLTLFISSSDTSTLIKITLYERSDRLDRWNARVIEIVGHHRGIHSLGNGMRAR